MVGTVRHKALTLVGHEHRRDHGDIGQVGPAQIGVVDHHHIPGLPVDLFDDIAHGEGHTAQVDRDMGRLRTQPAPGIKHRAGKIQPITNIRREGRPLQHGAHLRADRADAIGKQAQFNRIKINVHNNSV